ncbi:hypothetical protein Hsero_0776 [Herbaspirillum seropedicae SmR1]|uniref:Uncharacterized protein n=1 Tax=Herbaspirillum seropedicae (strain SmR1) TaxID=757424 RepID=D8IZH5_HERSS|nr:hypothetical protein Hsero_0776 [Herbaspirillum seropedicae SmR1]
MAEPDCRLSGSADLAAREATFGGFCLCYLREMLLYVHFSTADECDAGHGQSVDAPGPVQCLGAERPAWIGTGHGIPALGGPAGDLAGQAQSVQHHGKEHQRSAVIPPLLRRLRGKAGTFLSRGPACRTCPIHPMPRSASACRCGAPPARLCARSRRPMRRRPMWTTSPSSPSS